MARKTPIRHDPVVGIFAARLRAVRRLRGMTQRDLARSTHLTESYLSRLEAGLIAPGIDLVARISRALGSPIGELLASDDMAVDTAGVLKEQAKRLFDAVTRAPDPSHIQLLNQILVLIAESVERQR
jgi:transcriptional regulator with XRE-family HTH domain